MNQETHTKSDDTLISDLPISKIVSNKFLFTIYFIYSILLQGPNLIETNELDLGELTWSEKTSVSHAYKRTTLSQSLAK